LTDNKAATPMQAQPHNSAVLASVVLVAGAGNQLSSLSGEAVIWRPSIWLVLMWIADGALQVDTLVRVALRAQFVQTAVMGW
jgi:hypothetical protein